ncbi:MAG: methylmalonyl-CoA mutase [Spirochaetes bacterium]|jgi:methylmalonyl-CoA mutase C-terminal domain/subunit|nr:methylmalonyl-CoA mutase [Spirochaetota bacterium]
MAERRNRAAVRILIGKPGLDGHDRGAKYIARALRDAGYEVIYTGIRQTPESIVSTAIQEDVQFVGLSLLSGAHSELFPKVVELLRDQGAEDIVVFGGGVIPEQDISDLKEAGVAEVFGPGTPISQVIEFIEQCRSEKS